MCGIGFIINYGQKPLDLDHINSLWSGLSDRGTDASGIYYERYDNKKLITAHLIKAPIPSNKLFPLLQKNKKWKLIGNEKIILLHTRSATHGTKINNENNMPIFSDNYILIHNGVVYGDKIETYTYKSDVDSENILANIEHSGIQGGLQKVDGSMSCILRKRNTPYIYLYKNTNPLDLLYCTESKILMGSSNISYVPIADKYQRLSTYLFSPTMSTMTTLPYIIYTININKPFIEAFGKINQEITKKQTYDFKPYEKKSWNI